MLWRLFRIFFRIGLFSIGGGYAIIPLIQEQVVENRAWLSMGTFTDIISISQMTPGPLAVNTSTFVGMQIAGIPGAVVATVGSVISGVGLSVLLYRIVHRYQSSTYILELLNGLKATSVGLIISAAATIMGLAFVKSTEMGKTVDWMSLIIFGGAFWAVRKRGVNPIYVMVASGLIGMLVAG